MQSTNKMSQILGNIHPSGFMVNHSTTAYMSTIKQWLAKKIDFVMTFTQANAKTDKIFMERPKSYDLKGAA